MSVEVESSFWPLLLWNTAFLGGDLGLDLILNYNVILTKFVSKVLSLKFHTFYNKKSLNVAYFLQCL